MDLRDLGHVGFSALGLVHRGLCALHRKQEAFANWASLGAVVRVFASLPAYLLYTQKARSVAGMSLCVYTFLSLTRSCWGLVVGCQAACLRLQHCLRLPVWCTNCMAPLYMKLMRVTHGLHAATIAGVRHVNQLAETCVHHAVTDHTYSPSE